MDTPQVVSKDHFMKRISDLCLRSGLSGFPKEDIDQHILLKSAVLALGQAEVFTEKEINEKLKYWNQQVQMKDIDHVTMRRQLVDTGYLTRSKDGSEYHVSPNGRGRYQFEDAIEQLDIAEMIAAARKEIEQRKRAYLEKSRKG
jgi:hypothetical protein